MKHLPHDKKKRKEITDKSSMTKAQLKEEQRKKKKSRNKESVTC